MLNQRNIMFNVYSLKQVEDIRHGDVNIALLPFHHTFGATGQLLMYSCGVTTVFCDGLKYLQKNFVEYHVSVFIGVPLLMEAMYKKIMAGIRRQGKEKTFERGVKLSRMLRKVKIDVRRKLFKDVLDELGGSLRMVVSGASALDSAVIRGYEDLGIEVVQGYGMTESAPVIAAENLFNRVTDAEYGAGVLAVVKKNEPDAGIIDSLPADSNILVLDRIQDPGNMGTMIRTAVAAGYSLILAVRGTVDIYSPKVLRATAGMVFEIPVIYVSDAAELSDMIVRSGKKAVVTVPDGGRPY
jgi:long-chain acyl-CoA synthetase